MNPRSRRMAVAIVFSASLPAMADEASVQPEEMTQQRHRAESVQWIPESITVIGRDEMDETYRYQLEDLEGIAPGLLIDGMGAVPQGAAISIRGMGSMETSKAFFPAVAVNVDGVYQGTHASQNQVLFDFERVEIARGPQGTFSGAPSLAGTINVERTRPTGELGIRSRASFGDFNRKRFDTVINLPTIGGELDSKISFNWRRGNAKMVENVFSNRKENEDHLQQISASVLWQREDISVQYTYDDGYDKTDVGALLNLSSASDLLCSNSIDEANCSLDENGLKPETDSFAATTQNFSNAREYDYFQHAARVNFSWLEHDITSISAYRESEESSSHDLDATFIDFYSSTLQQEYTQVSQEVTAFREFNADTSYVVGIYYLGTEYNLDRSDLFVLEQIAAQNRILAVPAGETRTIDSNQRASILSAFAHADYQWNDKWRWDAGVRANRVKLDFNHTVSRPNNASNGFAAPPAILVGDIKQNEVTGTLGFSYRVDDEAMVYGRYSHGFRPGGYDDTANSIDAGKPFDEERVEGGELGLKSDWYEDRVRLNYAYYHNNYHNRVERFTRAVDSTRVESVLQNVAKVETRGHELELTYIPFEELIVRASLSHQNADYIDFTIPDLSGAAATVNLQGSRIPPLAPADMFSLSGHYSFGYGEGVVNLYGGYRFVTEYWTDSEVPAGRVENFTTLNFSAEFVWRDWKFRLFSQNANNKRHLTNVTHITDSQLASLPPTTTTELDLVTTAEMNQPEFTGVEIIWVPSLNW